MSRFLVSLLTVALLATAYGYRYHVFSEPLWDGIKSYTLTCVRASSAVAVKLHAHRIRAGRQRHLPRDDPGVATERFQHIVLHQRDSGSRWPCRPVRPVGIVCLARFLVGMFMFQQVLLYHLVCFQRGGELSALAASGQGHLVRGSRIVQRLPVPRKRWCVQRQAVCQHS